MEMHTDTAAAFRPLETYLSVNTKMNEEEIEKYIDEYMYMYHDAKFYYYKHTVTRQYLDIPHSYSEIKEEPRNKEDDHNLKTCDTCGEKYSVYCKPCNDEMLEML